MNHIHLQPSQVGLLADHCLGDLECCWLYHTVQRLCMLYKELKLLQTPPHQLHLSPTGSSSTNDPTKHPSTFSNREPREAVAEASTISTRYSHVRNWGSQHIDTPTISNPEPQRIPPQPPISTVQRAIIQFPSSAGHGKEGVLNYSNNSIVLSKN